MKPRERGGVVDPKLNVYEVEGLKVAGRSQFIFLYIIKNLLNSRPKLDVSIPPSNVNSVSSSWYCVSNILELMFGCDNRIPIQRPLP